jgi:hypothetical protein
MVSTASLFLTISCRHYADVIMIISRRPIISTVIMIISRWPSTASAIQQHDIISQPALQASIACRIFSNNCGRIYPILWVRKDPSHPVGAIPSCPAWIHQGTYRMARSNAALQHL